MVNANFSCSVPMRNLLLRLHALREPRDQFVARFDRGHVNDVTSHAGYGSRREGDERAGTIHGPQEGGQCGSAGTVFPLVRLREVATGAVRRG